MKNFEKKAPKIIHKLRELTIRITLVLCQYAKLRNADFVQHQLEVDGGSEKPTIDTDLREVLNNDERKANSTLNHDDFIKRTMNKKENKWLETHANSVLDNRSMPLADGFNTFYHKFGNGIEGKQLLAKSYFYFE